MRLKKKRPQTIISKGISLVSSLAEASMEMTHPLIRIMYKTPYCGLLTGCKPPPGSLISSYLRLFVDCSVFVAISGRRQRWGYEEGPSKGSGPRSADGR